MLIKRFNSFPILLVILSMAISPAFALGSGNRNLLLIGIMFISPLVIFQFPYFYRKDFWLLSFILSIILFPLIGHPESMRWSTVFYSIMFCLTFMAYFRLLINGRFSINKYFNLIKYLIYAYFVVLLIQQFCILSGLPVINLSNYNPGEPWKLNSLAAEPSHSARIVGLLMYCFITIKEIILRKGYLFIENIREDKWVWIAFIWTMVTMGSGTAFLFIPIILLKFIKFRNIVPIMILIVGIIIIVERLGITTIDRTVETFLSVLTFDENRIIETDPSAAMRIVPVIIFSKMIDFTTFDGWFGHGIDYVGTVLFEKMSGVHEGASGGGMLQIAMEYGLISAFIFLLFSAVNSITRKDYLTIVFWVLLVFLNGVNHQITWLAIILLYTNKYFLNLPLRKCTK